MEKNTEVANTETNLIFNTLVSNEHISGSYLVLQIVLQSILLIKNKMELD